MLKRLSLKSPLAAALSLSAVLAGAATTADCTASLELWSPYSGPTAKNPPKMEQIAGPGESKGLKFTAQDAGQYQGAVFTPATPIKLEAGDVLKLQLRQKIGGAMETFTLNGQFGNLGAHITTAPVGGNWTEITVPFDPAKWNFSKGAPTEFGPMRSLSVYPGSRMDMQGEAFAVAGMQIVKADGTVREIALPDSLTPTEAEAKWMDPANWQGLIGNDQVKIAAKAEAMDTPEGKAIVARPVQEGPYQGLICTLPEPVDLKKYKALTFEVKQTAGPTNAYLWLDYTTGGGVSTSFPTTLNDWRKVRIDFDYENLTPQSSAADPAPGTLKRLRMTCYGALNAPGKELAVRNFHLVPKEAAELAAEAKAAAEEEDW